MFANFELNLLIGYILLVFGSIRSYIDLKIGGEAKAHDFYRT